MENGLGLEGIVTKTGKSVIVEDAANDPRFDGTVFDDNGLVTKTMICVPLNNLHDIIGCVQVVNKKDGSLYDAEELQLCERMASLAAITIDEKGLLVDLGEKKEVLAELKDVTKEFQTGDTVLQVLKGINLEVYKNEFVVLFIFMGAVMAGVVLMNLTNMYVLQKKRELTIMRVNGFTTRETVRYLLRETYVTTGLGILLGLGIGSGIGYIILRSLEQPFAQFVRSLSMPAWIVGAGLTLLFTVIVNLIALRPVKKLRLTDVA